MPTAHAPALAAAVALTAGLAALAPRPAAAETRLYVSAEDGGEVVVLDPDPALSDGARVETQEKR